MPIRVLNNTIIFVERFNSCLGRHITEFLDDKQLDTHTRWDSSERVMRSFQRPIKHANTRD